MARQREWGNGAVGRDDPVTCAVDGRDRSVIDMVDQAVRHSQVMLAYQAVVTAGAPDKPAFYEGLIRVLDATGRVIPARDFIDQIEVMETGRVIDCLALQNGLRMLANIPNCACPSTCRRAPSAMRAGRASLKRVWARIRPSPNG